MTLPDVPRAPTADESLKKVEITPERHRLIKNLQALNPALDYGTLEVLTRLTEEEVNELFPPEDKAPEGYYDLKHPKTLVSHEMSIVGSEEKQMS